MLRPQHAREYENRPQKAERPVTRRELRAVAIQAAMIKRGTTPSVKEIFARKEA